jgi:1-acyl-sn-glycerol-3-phosphate acyltransferase
MQVTGAKIRMIARLLIFLSLAIIALPIHVVSLRMNEDARAATVRWVFRVLMFCLGFTIRVHGKAVEDQPCVYVCNHVSYLDIPVLGTILKASFVSRADVGSWPLIGWFARLQRTVLIERKPELARQHATTIRARIETGDRLLFFPEGTSGDGQRLLPFKSSLFDVAKPIMRADGSEQQVTVQPISLIVTELGNLPIGRHQRPFYAWFGDMEFAPHFLEALSLPGFTIDVQLHAPVTMAQFANRKALAAHCEQVMAAGLSCGLAGRGWDDSQDTALPAPATTLSTPAHS